MATEPAMAASDGRSMRAVLSGVVGGVIGGIIGGLLIQFGFDPQILSEDLPRTFGITGLGAGWVVMVLYGLVIGLVYAGIAIVPQLRGYAVRPNTGAGLGLAYGLLVWAIYAVAMSAIIGVQSVGAYPLTTGSVLTFGLVGLIIGIVYGMSPYT